MTVVTFRDADDTEFPITLIGRYETMQDAVARANETLTKAILDGDLNPKRPIRLDVDLLPYEWGGTQ